MRTLDIVQGFNHSGLCFGGFQRYMYMWEKFKKRVDRLGLKSLFIFIYSYDKICLMAGYENMALCVF